MLIAIFLILFSLHFVLPEDNILQNPLLPLKPVQQMVKQLPSRSSPFPVNFSDFHPFNVTINHLSSRSVRIHWSCKDDVKSDRFEVTIKPVLASYKVIETVPNNVCFFTMEKLEPDTVYQVAVASIVGRSRRRSGYVMFRTFMEDDYTEFAEDEVGDSEDDAKGRLRMPRVRLVEISLVGMALVLWAGAIVLFFHRWGKIRMLLPYQPDYKEMKNNNAMCTTCSMTPHHQCQKVHHLQNPTSECYQAQGTTTNTNMSHHHTPHHLPHQPMSEPGPSSCIGEHSNVNLVTLADTGCSPIRCKIPYFNEEGDISFDMPSDHQLHVKNIQRKARSAEQLKHYVYPWEEPFGLECTEF